MLHGDEQHNDECRCDKCEAIRGQRFQIDINGTVVLWGVDEASLLTNLKKALLLSPDRCVMVSVIRG